MRLMYNSPCFTIVSKSKSVHMDVFIRVYHTLRPRYTITYDVVYNYGTFYQTTHKRQYAMSKQTYNYIKATYKCQTIFEGVTFLVEKIVR